MMSRVRSLWRNLVLRQRVDREIVDEVGHAYELLVEEKMRSGLSESDARRAATIELGRVDSIAAQVRDVRAGAFIEPLVQDVRHGVRLLLRSPAFAAFAGVSLALGIGATAAATPRPLIYVPFAQQFETDIAIVARSPVGKRLTSEIRNAVASLNRNLPIVAASRLSDRTGPVHLQLRLSAAVTAGVGAVGLLLAAIGIFGVTAYAVTRRTREIGIRVAMGAQRSNVVRMVLQHGMSLVGIGCAAGLVLAAAASRLLVNLLFGVPPLDPVSFGGSMVVFGAVGLAACYVPARRATQINAVEALRYE